MKRAPRDGGSAFPQRHPQFESDIGMSLRGWFAGQALIGILASEPTNLFDRGSNEAVARRSFLIADAMLAEGAK